MDKGIYKLKYEDLTEHTVYVTRSVSFQTFLKAYAAPYMNRLKDKKVCGIEVLGRIEKQIAYSEYPEITMQGELIFPDGY